MTEEPTDGSLMAEQVEYYRARAPEYDQWFLRLGRYDRGAEHRRRWMADLGRVEAALAAEGDLGSVLELAAGTGQWTGRLASAASDVTAVDASLEALAINRRKHAGTSARWVAADLFAWRPRRRFDFVFLGFWLSHVPPARFAAFWELVDGWLAAGGRVFFVDSARTAESTARDHRLPASPADVVGRRLDDGRAYRVVKVFYEPAELAARLRRAGWVGAVQPTSEFFIHGRWRRQTGAGAGGDGSASSDSISSSSSATSAS